MSPAALGRQHEIVDRAGLRFGGGQRLEQGLGRVEAVDQRIFELLAQIGLPPLGEEAAFAERRNRAAPASNFARLNWPEASCRRGSARAASAIASSEIARPSDAARWSSAASSISRRSTCDVEPDRVRLRGGQRRLGAALILVHQVLQFGSELVAR